MNRSINKAIMFIFIVLSYVFVIYTAALFKHATNTITYRNFDLFIQIAIVAISIIALNFVIQMVVGRIHSDLSVNAAAEKKKELFRHLSLKSPEQLNNKGSREIVQTILYDTEKLVELNLERQILIFRLIGALSLTIFGFVLNLYLSLSIIFLFFVSLAIEKFFSKKFNQLTNQNIEAETSLKAFFRRYKLSFPVIKSSHKNDVVNGKFNMNHHNLEMNRTKTTKLAFFYQFIAQLFTTMYFVFFISIAIVLAHLQLLQFADVIAFIIINNRFTEPIQLIIRFITMKHEYKVYDNRVKEVEVLKPKSITLLTENDYSLVISPFSYCYKDDDKQFDFVERRLAKGKLTRIVGYNGTGKSTYLKAISGILYVDSNLQQNKFDGEVQYIGKQSSFYNVSIKENVLLGRTIDEPYLYWLANKLHVDFIEHLSNGWDTVLFENGTELSFGQYQRLAILRAMVEIPKLLILDEALSGVSEQQEKSILIHIETMMKDGYVLLVSHREEKEVDSHMIILDEKVVTL